MSDNLNIDLSGLEDKFSTSGAQVCALCGRDYDNLPEEEYEKEDGDTVPLLLWRNEGKEMLTLCWKCAEPRMKAPNETEGTKMKTTQQIANEICAGSNAEIAKLNKARFKIPVELDATCATTLVGTLQLAMRHPQFDQLSAAGQIISEIIAGIVSRIPPDCPNIRKLIEAGFDKSFDE